MKSKKTKKKKFSTLRNINRTKRIREIPSSGLKHKKLNCKLSLPFTEANWLLARLDECRSIKELPDVMTMNKRKLVMESNKHMLNYIEILPGRLRLGGSYLNLTNLLIGQLVFVTFKRDLKPISNKNRAYIRVDTFLHYEGKLLIFHAMQKV